MSSEMSGLERGDDAAELARRLLPLLYDEAGLVRAVASGRRRDAPADRPWRRAELRYVDLSGGRALQVVRYDATQAFTENHRAPATDAAARVAVEELAAEPFAGWHVETTTETHQLRLTRKGRLVHQRERLAQPRQPDRSHDRGKRRLLPAGSPVLAALGITDDRGRVKPSRQAKYRQVEELVRALGHALDAAQLRTPTEQDPLRVADLGCGNAYLTFAAAAYLHEVRGLPVRLTGVDVKRQSREHNTALAGRLGWSGFVEFVEAGIDEARLDPPPEVVLALHACDTATDDALARALEWEAALVLAAPCCHHDVAAQLRGAEPPAAYAPLVRDGILRERLADTLTDALRASLLRSRGYRVEVVEFVASEHTPRNTLLRCVRTGARSEAAATAYDDLVGQWRLRPRLGELLGHR